MIFNLIFAFALVIFLLSLWANDRTALKPNKNMLLGVTLPHEKLENPKVLEILRQYQKSYRILFASFIAAAVPIFFIPYVSLVFLYLFLWIAAFMLANDRVVVHHIGKMLALKRKYDWFLGEKHIVLIDTEVTRQKEKLAVSPLWLILPFAVSFVPLLMNWFQKSENFMALSLSLSSAACSLLCFILHRIVIKSGSRAVCENTSINLAMNSARIHSWTLCWVLFAFVESIGSLLLYFTSFILDVSTLPFAIVIAITVLISAGLIFGTYYHVRQMQNRLLSCSSEPIIADEDEYWAKGYYCNPHDTNTTIEKRIGYGYTYNMATAKGKAMTYGSLIAAAALFLGLTALFMVMDFTPIRMTVDGGTVKISAPMYGYEFPAVDIQSVSLEETLPSSGIRTNGASTAQYDLGNFSVPEYGAVKAYLYKQYPPFLVIELPDLYVIINSKSSEVTQEYYDLLMQTMSK